MAAYTTDAFVWTPRKDWTSESGKYSHESDRSTEQVERRQLNCGQTWKSVYGLKFRKQEISVESEATDWQ